MADKQNAFNYNGSLVVLAGQTVDFIATGTHFCVLTNSISPVNMEVSVDNGPFREVPTGKSIPMPQRADVPELREEFTLLRFKNPSAGNATITVAASFGEIRDAYVYVTGELEVSDIANGLSTPAKYALNVGNAYTQTFAIDTTRKALLIVNLDDVEIWVGDTNVDPANERGVPLTSRGDSLLISATALVKVRSNAVNAKFSVMNLTKT